MEPKVNLRRLDGYLGEDLLQHLTDADTLTRRWLEARDGVVDLRAVERVPGDAVVEQLGRNL